MHLLTTRASSSCWTPISGSPTRIPLRPTNFATVDRLQIGFFLQQKRLQMDGCEWTSAVFARRMHSARFHTLFWTLLLRIVY